MKEALFNLNTYTPVVDGEMLDQFLRRIGVSISMSPDKYSMVTIRVGPNATIYGFKNTQDSKAMADFLIEHEIDFKFDTTSKGARFPYHIILEK